MMMQQYYVTLYHLQLQKSPHTKERSSDWLSQIISIHVFRSFEDDLHAMPVRPCRR